MGLLFMRYLFLLRYDFGAMGFFMFWLIRNHFDVIKAILGPQIFLRLTLAAEESIGGLKISRGSTKQL